MTYARKVAVGYAFKNSFQGVDSEVTEVEVMILEAMQAQREACAYDGKIAALCYSSLGTARAIEQAILNAEVQP